MKNFKHVTKDSSVQIYESAKGVFDALLREIRELSKNKPDATLNKSKVKLVNAVLEDLLIILKTEPEGKYLLALEDEDLPQVSDALMMMVQFNAALTEFKDRYWQYVKTGFSDGHWFWITEEQMKKWKAEGVKVQ